MNHTLPQVKQQTVIWAQTILSKPSIIVDFETTGVKDAEIVQVAVIDVQGNTLMNTFVKPSSRIPSEATLIHGITNQMVEDAPSFQQVYVQFSTLLAGKTAVAYNAGFEKGILSSECTRRKLPIPKPKQWDCAMQAYAKFWGQWNMHRKDFAWQKLTAACQQQNITVENAHNALGDCQMTLKLLRVMAAS